ncbi:MAG: uroporphyrinogen-III synthase [Arcobacteraceae bacterium]
MSQPQPIYILSDKKVQHAINLPMIEISYISTKVDLSSYDALLFTSKNAIKALDSFDESWKSIASYVIAPQTAKVLESMGGNLHFVGEKSHGDDFAQEIAQQLHGKKVLYVCGKKVVSNLTTLLNENGVSCESLVVYETVCKKYEQKITLPKGSVVIFSSPSTIECFFKNITSWDESYSAISIGKTTAKYFPNYITPFIANSTSLDACVEKAFEILNT